MIPEAREVRISRKDRKILEARCRSPVTLQRDLKRARIVLLAAEGRSTRSIAKEVGVQPRIVSLWRRRFADRGLEGLEDKPRPGKVSIYTKATGKRILVLLDKPAPTGFARWTGPLLAAALGDVMCKCLAVSAGPEDRSSGPQVLVREQRSRLCVQGCRCCRPLYSSAQEGHCSMRRRKAFDPGVGTGTGLSEAAQWAGADRSEPRLQAARTTTLFAALEVASGKVLGEHSKRRRRVEFLGFMNKVVAAFPGRELHVILDNLNTHKKNERWLKKHPSVKFHFIPTRASWLNQVETWFSILQGRPKDTMSSPNLRRRNNPLPTRLIVQSLRRDHKQPQHRLRQSWSCH